MEKVCSKITLFYLLMDFYLNIQYQEITAYVYYPIALECYYSRLQIMTDAEASSLTLKAKVFLSLLSALCM